MPSKARSRQRPNGFQESIAYPVLWPVRYAIVWSLLLLVLALISISVDLVFAKKVWVDGAGPDQMVALIRHAISLSPNPHFAERMGEGVYWVFFGLTGVHEKVLGLNLSSIDLAPGAANFVLAMRDEIVVAMYGAKLFGVRLATVINALPLLCVAYAVFMIDGAAERLIRKVCAGRESATIYHLAKHSHFALLPVLLAVYLCLPVEFEPLWMVLPAILVSGFLVRLQAKYYKKYV